MKKIAMLIALCMLTTGMAAYAEEAQTAPETENVQTEAPDMAEVEINREVWRGEVTAIEDGALTLKILEYNPEHARLPMPELPEDELPESEVPEEPTAEEEQDPAVALTESEEMPAEEAAAGQEAVESEAETETAPETGDAEGEEEIPVEIVSIITTEETLCYTSAAAGTGEIGPEAAENAEELPENAEELPENAEAAAPIGQYVFEEAALEDVAIGDILTVEIIDGVASIVVIETDAAVQNEIGM